MEISIAEAVNGTRTLARQFEGLKKVIDVLDSVSSLDALQHEIEVRVAALRIEADALAAQNATAAADLTRLQEQALFLSRDIEGKTALVAGLDAKLAELRQRFAA